jgi:hypothetical protein
VNGLLQGVKIRLDLAERRVTEFGWEIESFLKTNPYDITRDIELDSNKLRGDDDAIITLKLIVKNSPPDRLRLLAGEAIHDLRSSLDNLIWGLGQIVGCKDDNLSLEFYETSDYFDKKYIPKINKFPVTIQNWIRSIQNFQNPTSPHILYKLHKMWNFDKHRKPVLLANIIPTIQISPRPGALRVPFRFYDNPARLGGILKNGDQITKYVTPIKDIDDLTP